MGFNVYRCDRLSKRGDGVLDDIKNNIHSFLAKTDPNIELLWICIHSQCARLYTNVCYRPPDSDTLFVNNFHDDAVLDLYNQFPNVILFLLEGFNFPHFDWDLFLSDIPGRKSQPCRFLQPRLTLNVSQVIQAPTLPDKTFHLPFKNVPDCANSITSFSGNSDHNLISFLLSLPIITKHHVKELIRDYKGYYKGINKKLRDFFSPFSNGYEIRTVNENWLI